MMFLAPPFAFLYLGALPEPFRFGFQKAGVSLEVNTRGARQWLAIHQTGT